jgi:tRNA1(Val) A37 N6-methylase TrmN6
MKSDLVICNPPYHLGNRVVKNSIDCCKDRLSVIMSLSQYKKGDLFS